MKRNIKSEIASFRSSNPEILRFHIRPNDENRIPLKPLAVVHTRLWKLAADKASHSALVRAVGFGFWPDSASDFVARFIAERTGGHAR
jgi:hypothetical protein